MDSENLKTNINTVTPSLFVLLQREVESRDERQEGRGGGSSSTCLCRTNFIFKYSLKYFNGFKCRRINASPNASKYI